MKSRNRAPSARHPLYFGGDKPMDAAQRAKFHAAVEEQKRRKAEAGKATFSVHGDKLYEGWSDGLGCYVCGRTHDRELCKKGGWRHCG